MPVDWERFQTPASGPAKRPDWERFQQPSAGASGIDWARFQTPLDPVVNAQHPELSTADRTKITTLADNPYSIAAWLNERGFETDYRDGEVILRKPGEKAWHKVEKTGWLPNEWADISDLGNEAAEIWAMTKGATMAGAPAATLGGPVAGIAAGVLGGAAGGAAAETARAGARRAAGFKQSLPEELGAIGTAGTSAALAEAGGQLLGKGIRRGASAIKGKLASREAAKAAAAAAPLGESIPEQTTRQALARKVASKVKPGVDADAVLKEFQAGRLTADQVRARLGPSVTDKALQRIQRPAQKGYVPQQATEPILGPSSRAGQRRAAAHTLEEYEAKTADDITRALDPYGKLPPGYEKSTAGGPKWGVPRQAFETLPPEEFFAKLPEQNIREIANLAGIQERGVPVKELVRRLTKSWAKVQPAIVDKRWGINQMLDAGTREVGKQRMPTIWEAVLREKGTGNLRRMRFSTNPPVTAKEMSREQIRQAVEWLPLEDVRRLAGSFRQKLERGIPKKLRKMIPVADRDGLIDILFGAQKLGFRGKPPYEEMPHGLRWVWDYDVMNWRSLSLDFVHSLRPAKGKLVDFTRPGWQQSGPWQDFLRGTGRMLERTGRALETPIRGLAAAGKKVAEFMGAPGQWGAGAGWLSPYGAAAYVGGPGAAGTLAGYTAAARGLQGLGRVMQRDTGSLLARLIHRAPPALIRPLRKILKILDVDGEQAAAAALYVLLQDNPQLERLVRKELPELSDAVQKRETTPVSLAP